MKKQELNNLRVDQLAKLISIDGSSPLSWTEDDLRASLTELLDSKLGEILRNAAPPGSGAETSLTVLDFLSQPHPSLPSLNGLKAFAKAAQSGRDVAFSRDVGIVLYYAAIIAAQNRLHQRLTQLSDEELQVGIEWMLSRTWLDERLKPLVRTAEIT